MPKPQEGKVLTLQNKRHFIQLGGASPDNRRVFAGTDTQLIAISGATASENGDIESVNAYVPSRPKTYQEVARMVGVPSRPSFSMTVMENKGTIPFQLVTQRCPINVYEVSGECRDLGDFTAWEDYVLIYSFAERTERDLGARSSFDSDEALLTTLTYSAKSIYPVGAMGFVREAVNMSGAPYVDATFGVPGLCSCNDGADWFYAIQDGANPIVVYTNDRGRTWYQQPILSLTASPLAIRLVGERLLILLDNSTYAWADIGVTGIPGDFSIVSNGFIPAGVPRDIYVQSVGEVYFVGDGGYIYQSDDITNGVYALDTGTAAGGNNLRRVTGDGDGNLAAVGANGVIVVSTNRGKTWQRSDVSPASDSSFTAVAMRDADRIWVGTEGGHAGSAGRIYWTATGGRGGQLNNNSVAAWNEYAFPDAGSGTINDIKFATDEVGWFVTSSTSQRLYATIDGGFTWARTTSRIVDYPLPSNPTYISASRIAIPEKSLPEIASNSVAVVGAAQSGLGFILMAQSEVM